jgi:L-ascorbate metabolism protein UlaG (beta-lactamase superfamily)
MELVYHGWSCFTLVTARGRLVFDPNWTNPFGRPHTGPASFADAELCLATHGHFDHIQDFDFIGLRSHSPADFIAAVRGAAPTVEVEAVEPGRRIPL